MDIGSAPQGDKRYYRLPLVIVIIGLTTGFAVFVTLSVLQRNNVRDEFMRNARIQTERLDLAAASYNAVLHSANLIVTQSSDDRVATESLSQLPLITAIADYRVSADRLNVKKGLSYSRDQMSFLRRVAVASINKTQPAVRIYGEPKASDSKERPSPAKISPAILRRQS